MDDHNDAGLLKQYVEQQSEAAFAELVRRQVNFVFSVALRYVGNPPDAQDVTQAVFVILAQKAPGLCRRATVTGWLYETTRLTAAHWLRARNRRFAREQEAYMQSTIDPAGQDPLWPQLAPHLEEAMTRLRAADRELLALRFYENKTGEEAAALLGIGAAAAHKRTRRALEKLQKFFATRGIASTTEAIAGAVSAHSVLAAPAGLAKVVTAAAVAKGATASSAGLTLMKGVLKIMAWSKVKMAVGITAGVLFAAGTTVTLVKAASPIQEPSYQGRSLTEWLADLEGGFPQKGAKQLAAEDAIRHLGAATLPFLMNDLIVDPRRQPHLRRLHPDNRPPDRRSSQAVDAFEALGPVAKPAIPELVRYLDASPGFVPLALAGIGRDAVPQMEAALTNRNFFVRDNMAAGLANAVLAGRIAPEDVAEVVPLAARNLAYTDSNRLFEVNTRFRAAGLLAAIHLNPEVAVPALIDGLHDARPQVAGECADALGRFGPDARPAAPALADAMTATNADLRGAVCWALSQVDPNALVQNILPQTVALTTNANVAAQMKALWALRQVGPKAGRRSPR